MTRHLTDETIDLLLAAHEAAAPGATEHLAGCEACRNELELARLVEDALAAVPRMTAPAALLQGVMTALVAARRRRRRLVAFGLVAAAAALAVVVLWVLSGGVATVVVDGLAMTRSLAVAARVLEALWAAMPVPLALAAALVLLASTAALGRLVARATGEPTAPAEAG